MQPAPLPPLLMVCAQPQAVGASRYPPPNPLCPTITLLVPVHPSLTDVPPVLLQHISLYSLNLAGASTLPQHCPHDAPPPFPFAPWLPSSSTAQPNLTGFFPHLHGRLQQSLHAKHCDIRNLPACCCRCSTLQKLTLPFCDIGVQGAAALAVAITPTQGPPGKPLLHPKLTLLDLQVPYP